MMEDTVCMRTCKRAVQMPGYLDRTGYDDDGASKRCGDRARHMT